MENPKNRNLKVALVASEQYPIPPVFGGAIEVKIFNLARSLKDFYDITIFSKAYASFPDNDSTSRPKHTRIGLSYLEKKLIDKGIFKFDRFYSFNSCFPYQYRLAKALKKLSPDIIHIFNRPQYVPLIRKYCRNCHIIVTMCNDHLVKMSYKDGLLVTENVDMIVGISKYIVSQITDRYSAAVPKARLCYNAIDTNEFRPHSGNEDGVEKLRKQFNITKGKTLLFTGRLVPEKGVHILLKAMKVVVGSEKDAKLLIVGNWDFSSKSDNKYTAELKSLSKDIEDNVRFLGFTPFEKMKKIYALGDIFVAPAQWDEPFGVVNIEAMASGLAVISTRKGGIPEIIVDRENGLLVDNENDHVELADHILSLMRNDGLRMLLGQNARRTIEEKFSFNGFVNTMKGYYNSLLN